MNIIKIEGSFEDYLEKHVAYEDQALFEANVMLAIFEVVSREKTLDWAAMAERGAEIRAAMDQEGR